LKHQTLYYQMILGCSDDTSSPELSPELLEHTSLAELVELTGFLIALTRSEVIANELNMRMEIDELR